MDKSPETLETPNRIELVGYLEEALPADEMARIEEKLRTSPPWRQALAELTSESDTGEHSVATVWRRHRLTCPSRERLGTYLLGGLPPDEEDYVRFHLEVIGCRWCAANAADLGTQIRGQAAEPARRRRFLESSIGSLPKKKGGRMKAEG